MLFMLVHLRIREAQKLPETLPSIHPKFKFLKHSLGIRFFSC
jgi:hypothetical protein